MCDDFDERKAQFMRRQLVAPKMAYDVKCCRARAIARHDLRTNAR